MKPLFTAKSPFENPPKVKEKIQGIEPKLVCEVAYAEITADEQLRQTMFLAGATTRILNSGHGIVVNTWS